MQKLIALLIGLASATLSSRILAEPAETAPPESASRPSVSKPSRLFMQMGAGAGLFRATSGASEDTRCFSGGSASLQLMLGSRVSNRFTIGGAYFRDEVFALSARDERIDGDEPDLGDVDMRLQQFGFFMDHAPFAKAGFHWQALLSYATLGVNRSSDSNDVDNPSGLAYALGVGYDFRLGRLLSVGALLRVSYAPLDVAETAAGKTDVDVWIPALLLTATLSEARSEPQSSARNLPIAWH